MVLSRCESPQSKPDMQIIWWTGGAVTHPRHIVRRPITLEASGPTSSPERCGCYSTCRVQNQILNAAWVWFFEHSLFAGCVVLSCAESLFVLLCLFINERNLLEMAKFALTVSLAILLHVISVLAVYTEDKCIKGQWHKASPSPETDAFKTCHAFRNSSCCTAEFTVELMANETRNLYNHSWHRCGQLSEKCQQFWITQECFYQCSPKVYQWAHPSFDGALLGVPVCSDICDQWFDACKNDQICVENVLEDYNFTVHGENFCPVNKSCITYQAMYGNGKNLCEKMWAGSYNYTVPNANYSNCLMMDGSAKPVKPTTVETVIPTVLETVKPTVESEGVINTAYIALLQLLLFVVAVML